MTPLRSGWSRSGRRCARTGSRSGCRWRHTSARRCTRGSAGTCSPVAGPAWSGTGAGPGGHPTGSGGRGCRGAAMLDGQVRGFANVCRHRGHELLPLGGEAGQPAVVCPYHGWSYRLDGALRAAPGVDRPAGGLDLAELPLVAWQGWRFVNAPAPTPPAAPPTARPRMRSSAASNAASPERSTTPSVQT
jgi:nitrite reductase/ring-hydroxylating ferredoxin subunit